MTVTTDGVEEASVSVDSLTKNKIFSEIHPRIKIELGKLGSVPEQDIIETLVNEIDENELDICRQMCFQESRLVIAKTLDDGTTTDFELKTRKQPNKNLSYAKDIVKLALYLTELKSEYPFDVLAKSTTYVNLRSHCKSKSVSELGTSKSLGQDKGPVSCGTNIKCDDCDVLKAKITSLEDMYRTKFDDVNNELATQKAKVVSMHEMYRSEIDSVKNDYSNQICTLKNELFDTKVAFTGRLHQLEKATGIVTGGPGTSQQMQQQPSQDNAQVKNTRKDQTNPATDSASSIHLTDEGSRASPPVQSQNNIGRYESLKSITESQMRNLSVTQLLNRADQMGQASDVQNSSISSREDARNNSSTSTHATTGSTDDSDSESADTENDDDVFVTHVDVGTSPKMVRVVFTGSAEEGKDIPPRNRTPSTESWKTPKTKKSKPRRRSSSSAQTNRSQTQKKPEFQGKPNSRLSTEGRKRKPASSQSSERKAPAGKSYLFEGKSSSSSTYEKSCTLFLQNIAKKDCPPKELADSIKEYGSKKGFQIKYARIFDNNNKNVVSCKIVVPESQSENLIGESSRVWPKEVTCRRWRESGPPHENETSNHNYRRASGPRQVKSQEPTRDWAGRKMSGGKVRADSSSSDWDNEKHGESGMYKTWYRKFIQYCYENDHDR